MRELMIVSALLIASQVVGCGKDTAVTDSMDVERSNINHFGYLGRTIPNGAPTGRVNLSLVLINSAPQSKPLNRNDKVYTQEYTLLQSRWAVTNFVKNNILFGPHPGVIGETAKMEVQNFDPLPINIPVVQIACGWVYLTGDDPQVQTNWVSAGATGSKIVMQITHDASTPPRPVHRFIFLEGSSGYVLTRGSPVLRRDFGPGNTRHYVDASDINTLSDITPIEPGSPVDNFLISIQPHILAMGAESMN